MSDTTKSAGKTEIQVSDELADALFELKRRGDTYEDVIRRLIDEQ